MVFEMVCVFTLLVSTLNSIDRRAGFLPVGEQMIDPRTENARSHQIDGGGKVVAVHVTVHEQPNTFWQCRLVRLIDEYAAQGQTVIRNFFDGAQSGNVFLLTGYQGSLTGFNERIPDTSGKGELVMAGANAIFVPPNLGPLAVCVDDYDSDIVASLGLANGRAISFEIHWVMRDRFSLSVVPSEDPLSQRVSALENRVTFLEGR